MSNIFRDCIRRCEKMKETVHLPYLRLLVLLSVQYFPSHGLTQELTKYLVLKSQK